MSVQSSLVWDINISPALSGLSFCRDFMSVTNDGKFNFYDVELISTNPSGKFYFQTPKSKGRVYEVSVDMFKCMLVTASEAKRLGTAPVNGSNSLEYLLDQVEMTEDIFKALLYPEWINENKE